MGTNYYAQSADCPHCGRNDGPVHVSKSHVMIQAHSEDSPTPWGPIKSWADWRAVIRAHGLRIFDEYGDEHDPEQFIAKTEATTAEARSRQHRWMVEHRGQLGVRMDYDWLDSDGFSVSSRAFS